MLMFFNLFNKDKNTNLNDSEELLETLEDIQSSNDLESTTDDSSNDSEEVNVNELDNISVLLEELTTEDYNRYDELIWYQYKNTTDEDIIRERTILANTIIMEEIKDLISKKSLWDYSDVNHIRINK